MLFAGMNVNILRISDCRLLTDDDFQHYRKGMCMCGSADFELSAGEPDRFWEVLSQAERLRAKSFYFSVDSKTIMSFAAVC
jgi:hypothetical protein